MVPLFSSFTSEEDCFITNRLGRIQTAIAALNLSTREDYIAQLTSMVNLVINEDYQMQELINISSQTPAIVGDPTTNMTLINQDCQDIADEIARLENNSSVLYNLTAATQNTLRQKIRESIYLSTSNSFIESFINQNQIASSTATIDNVAGRSMSGLINETILNPVLSIGLSSVGSTYDDIASLLSSSITNLFTWKGSTLEIIVKFPTPTIVNRLILQPDDYKGYYITQITASPDGSLFTDILETIGLDYIDLGPEAGNYSGTAIVDFPPTQVSTMSIIVQNLVDGTTIPLRSISLSQRSYNPTAIITSNPITSPTGNVIFQTEDSVFSPYVSCTYQISSDGIIFTTIQPGLLTLPSTWWYRVLFNRPTTSFINTSPVIATTSDPAYSTGFTLVSSTSTVISLNTLQVTLVFSNVTGVIPLNQTPLPGTLSISQGSVYLTNSMYSIDSNNNLSFPGTMTSVTVSYQTSAAGASNISSLQSYYTAFIDGISFNSQA